MSIWLLIVLSLLWLHLSFGFGLLEREGLAVHIRLYHRGLWNDVIARRWFVIVGYVLRCLIGQFIWSVHRRGHKHWLVVKCRIRLSYLRSCYHFLRNHHWILLSFKLLFYLNRPFPSKTILPDSWREIQSGRRWHASLQIRIELLPWWRYCLFRQVFLFLVNPSRRRHVWSFLTCNVNFWFCTILLDTCFYLLKLIE